MSRSGWNLAAGIAGIGILSGIGVFLYRNRRRFGRGLGVGIAPPHPEDEAARYDPWSEGEAERRLIGYFTPRRQAWMQPIIPRKLPRHVQRYAEYMRRKADTEATPRDIVKAYLLTVSSMGRGPIWADTVREYWPEFPGEGKVRAEDVLARSLLSPLGQRYLDAAERGQVDERAAIHLADRMRGYGLGNTLMGQMSDAVRLGQRAGEINDILRLGSKNDWYTWTHENARGIKARKAGFFASFLGRGDMSTADARELDFWLCPPGMWNTRNRACKTHIGDRVHKYSQHIGVDFMQVLDKRLRRIRMELPPRYEPFREHLTHHALFDAIKNEVTSHGDVVTAMELAGSR